MVDPHVRNRSHTQSSRKSRQSRHRVRRRGGTRNARPARPPRARRQREPNGRRPHLARPPPPLHRRPRRRTPAPRRHQRRRRLVARVQRRDLQPPGTARGAAHRGLRLLLRLGGGARRAAHGRARGPAPAARHVGAVRGHARRPVRRRPRRHRHQAPVLGAHRHRRALRLRTARVPPRRPAEGGDLPARLLVDARGRSAPVRGAGSRRGRCLGRGVRAGRREGHLRGRRRLHPCGI